ncbi:MULTISPECIES: hypothetical protein [Dermacoccus]|uniref:hypothetical protein n=1 Tax=Dermacoccus TaxID=57495 RepID=UPI0001E646BE|nr:MULTISPECIES: hypothetical protein [Dermacoccus]EFP58913.1 hypothetical protein HMPREF0321_0534 [Dermacoccus sp. Ellin185]MCT1603775.1 hypothetical protein [Dermacoccus nishinomiyaensis]
MTPPATRFDVEANLRDIAEDDALLDALGARSVVESPCSRGTTVPPSEARCVSALRPARLRPVVEPPAPEGDDDLERSPGEQALSDLFTAWTREIDATCEAVTQPSRAEVTSRRAAHNKDVSAHPVIDTNTTASRENEFAGGGRYLATGRPTSKRRTRRAWSGRASLTAVSAGAVVALSSVAAAVNGGSLSTVLAPLHLDWSNARAVAEPDVPRVQATAVPTPTTLPGPVAAAPSAPARSSAHGGPSRGQSAGREAARPETGPQSGAERSGEVSVAGSMIPEQVPSSVAMTTTRGDAPHRTTPGTRGQRSPQSTTQPPSTGSASSSRPSTSRPTGSSGSTLPGSPSSTSKPSSSSTSKPSSSRPSPSHSQPTSPTSPTTPSSGTATPTSPATPPTTPSASSMPTPSDTVSDPGAAQTSVGATATGSPSAESD